MHTNIYISKLLITKVGLGEEREREREYIVASVRNELVVSKDIFW